MHTQSNINLQALVLFAVALLPFNRLPGNTKMKGAS